MRARVLVAVIIGAVSATLCWAFLWRFGIGAADFGWPMRAAQDLLAGRDPYARPFNSYAIPYPLPAALVGVPFAGFRAELGGALFFGISSGLLAFGLTRDGYARLLIFLAYPYWGALITVQWSPLLMAAALFPVLLPVTLVKPQLGLPIALTYLTRRGALFCVAAGVVSLVIMPSWPWRWLGQIESYQRFIPLLILPGPLLLLALRRVRTEDGRLLLLTALLPQRWFYDNFILWLIPRTPREIMVTAVLSWVPAIWRWYHIPQRIEEVGLMAVLFFYLPMLVVVLLRGRAPSGQKTQHAMLNEEPRPVAS